MLYQHLKASGGRMVLRESNIAIKILSTGFLLFDFLILLQKRISTGLLRLHHEIYMSDARKVAPEKWKTVIRHPICEK